MKDRPSTRYTECEGKRLGAWLVESAPKGSPLAKASRASKRKEPFAPTAKTKPRPRVNR